MTTTTLPAPDAEQRVLLLMATARDAKMSRDVLARSGIEALACAGAPQLVAELRRGAGALMMAEEMLASPGLDLLADALTAQPAWSDIPALVLARQGADSRTLGRILERLPNLTVIERPVRVASLASAVQSTLRARRRQYELRETLDNLHEEDRRKTEFLATLAHELRNPLAPLRTTLALLANEPQQPALAARQHALMRRQVDHLARLVDDLLEVSRITRGKVDLQLSTVALESVIADALELSRPLIDGAGHRLSVDLGAVPLQVVGDAVRLTQVLANLLNNAAKFTPPGGRVELRAERRGDDAVIEVSDNGCGLAPDMQSLVFEMFMQVGGSARAVQGGLGIGLTLARSLIELQGGRISASSPGLGQGATFTISLPLAPEMTEAPGAAGPRAPAAPLGSAALQRRVLVVDDNRDAADSLAELLRLAGAQTFTAYSGHQALEACASLRPEVAILDIGMPDMDGCALAAQLRARPGGTDL
ncbi:MAG: hybrid sensor histidine kinase/response regulator, partial [Burkholderiaceae bacterium]